MADIGVVGLGNFGTALGNHLALAGHRVVGWSANAAIVDGVNREQRNPKYQSDTQLHPRLTATGAIDELRCCPAIVLAFPSSALVELLPVLRPKADTLVISAIKGLEQASLATPLTSVAHHYPKHTRIAVLSGPSFACDVVQGRPCALVAAARHESDARAAAEYFTNATMKVYVSTDPLGVELGGILKNVVALAAGVTDGLGLGQSAWAALVTRGLAEMMRLATVMGAHPQTLAGLSGLGDLSMTAASATSRNRTVGYRLGQGESLEHIVATLGSVAEGVKTTPLICRLAVQYNVELPIADAVSRLLTGVAGPDETARLLLSRPLRREFEDSPWSLGGIASG